MNFVYCPPLELPKLEAKTFDDGKRYYTTPDGNKYPSITSVLSATTADAIHAWRKRVGEQEANRISRQASSRGTNVHTLAEKYLNNDVKYRQGAMPDSMEMFDSIKPYVNKINNIHYQEAALYSDQLCVAGRVDVIAEYESKLSVIDFKTSKRIKSIDDISTYFWQTCFYALAYEELVGAPIHQLVIIMAVTDSEPLVFIQKTEDHIEGLVSAIDFYRKKNGKN